MVNSKEKISHYWNDQFEKMDNYDPKVPIDSVELEKHLDWVSETGGTIMDFGSGSGRMLLRCLEKGAIRTIGVDLSFHGISLSRRVASEHYETLKTKWIWGDVKSLTQLPDACLNGVILSNIIDNMLPDECDMLIEQVVRLLDKNGKLLIKLNAFLSEAEVQDVGLENVTEMNELIENTYTDQNGLYTWNISELALVELLKPHFKLEMSEEIIIKSVVQQRVYRFQLL
jgi:ubiquinone/menaquinone biosynthesis C-methylase UbiE